jgi:thiol:disulfide interchange protein DsbA
MYRGILIACALATAVAVAPAVRADAAKSSGLERWQAGTNYTVLATPQPPAVKRGRVVVNEVFWYGCSHCYALDPALESWKARKPAYIDFVRIPVIWGPTHIQHARLYYTMLELGRADLHPKIFDTIHLRGNMLAAETDEEARELHLAFFLDNGVTEQKFNAAYESPAVLANVQQAQTLTGRFEVASVPLIVVQGKYVTGMSLAGSEKNLFEIINDLAASEKGR